jgi:hypothetical protein
VTTLRRMSIYLATAQKKKFDKAEHYIKESKQILGLDQFQARKCLAWQHQVAVEFFSAFVYPEGKTTMFLTVCHCFPPGI